MKPTGERAQDTDATAREVALAGLPPDLRTECMAIAKGVLALERGNAMGFWRIGVRVNKVLADTARYGDRAAERIAAAVQSDPSILHRAGAIAEWFPEREQLEDLLARRGSDGRSRLSFSHLLQLLPLSDIKVRSGFVESVLTEGLTVRQLADRIRETVRGSQGGPKRAPQTFPMPRSLKGGLENLKVTSRSMTVRLRTTLPQCVLKSLAELSGEGAGVILEEVRDVRAHLEELAEGARAGADELRRAEERLADSAPPAAPEPAPKPARPPLPVPARPRGVGRPVGA